MKMLGLFLGERSRESGEAEASSSVLVRVRLHDVGTATVHDVDRIARAGAGRLRVTGN